MFFSGPDNQSFPPSSFRDLNGRFPSVLIIEHDVDMARVLGSCLNSKYLLYYAVNGVEGLNVARDTLPDLIIADFMMPEMDGIEVCRAVRNDRLTDHIAILILTEKTADRIACFKAGADACLCKPFNTDELMACVDQLIKQRRMLKEKWQGNFAKMDKTTDHPTDEINSIAADSASCLAHNFFLQLDNVILKRMSKGECNAGSVAADMGMSLSKLTRTLKDFSDTTPAVYITSLRLREAKKMLAQAPRYSVAEVAYFCRFADPAHFSHVFRRKEGLSPSQFVKNLKLGETDEKLTII